MLRVALALMLVGCGRIGFESPRDGSDRDGTIDIGDDGSTLIDAPPIDTPVGLICSTDLECGRCARCTSA